MKFDINAAKKAGYSDQEIVDYLSQKDSSFDVSKAKQSGYSDSEILDYLNERQKPSKTRSAISAPIKGLIKGLQGLNPLAAPGPISSKLGKKVTEELLPTREEHSPLERAGQLAPIVAMGPEGLLAKGLQLGAGVLGGEVAKEAGAGETGQALAEAGSMGLPGLAKGVAQKGYQALKGAPTKLPSGMTELQATRAKSPGIGTLSKERQTKVIEKLNQEAADLSKKSVEKNVPIIQEIERGVDFDAKFNQDFGKIERLAQKSNPEIDITPVSKLMNESVKKYKGIPKPHAEAQKILSEVRAFRNNPQTSLANLMKIYRSNNKKIRNSYERARLSGTQQEYVDFLVDQNKAIAESFTNTLPKDSAWIKMFDTANKEYKGFQDAKKVMNQLKGFLSAVPTKAEVVKLAENTKAQKQLALSMGEKGAQEITEIAKDLKKSIEAIKKIPKSNLAKFDATLPLYFLIPWIGKYLGSIKSLNLARYFYGYFLSTPARRRAYKEALNAVLRDDLNGYKKSLAPVLQELESQRD